MSQVIKIKHSTTTGNKPSSLSVGELALNVSDGNFFFGDGSNVQNYLHIGNTTASTLSITKTLVVTGQTVIAGVLNVSGNTDIDGSVNMNAHHITNLRTPGNPLEAANKLYVDQYATSGVSSVAISGSDGIDVDSGSPITSSGTIALGLSNIPNTSLTNSTVKYGGVELSLGDSNNTPAFNLSDATDYPGTSSLVTTGTITAGIWNSARLFTTSAEECGSMADYVTFGVEEALVCGKVYYYSGGSWTIANAGTPDTASRMLGMAMGTLTSHGMMLRGIFGPLADDPGSDGDILYLSQVDGQITNTAPTNTGAVVRVVGYALDNAPGIWWSPDNTWVELGVNAFTFTIDTENAGSATKTFVLPLVSDGTIDIDVDWGDDSTDNITAYDDSEVTHVYTDTGEYTIQMSGTIRGFQFANGGDKLKILNISQWGDFNITQVQTFQGCENLTSDATDSPSIVHDKLQYTFLSCTNLEGGCANWVVSHVTNMFGVFNGCNAFNSNLSSWDTSNVTTMRVMFSGAVAFTGEGIASWDTAQVDNMDSMFHSATAFNEDIGDWETGEVTTFYSMFRSPCAFNQDISSWDTAKCETIGAMFYWNTTFNQDISGWDMGLCTNMWGAFGYATSFEQDLGGWNIEVCEEFSNFLVGVTLDTANYDALLIGWGAQEPVESMTPNFGSSTYTGGGDAEEARNMLIDTYGWTITDGGVA